MSCSRCSPLLNLRQGKSQNTLALCTIFRTHSFTQRKNMYLAVLAAQGILLLCLQMHQKMKFNRNRWKDEAKRHQVAAHSRNKEDLGSLAQATRQRRSQRCAASLNTFLSSPSSMHRQLESGIQAAPEVLLLATIVAKRLML